MSSADTEFEDEPLWTRHREVYEDWLEGDDEVLRAVAKIVLERYADQGATDARR